MSQQNVDAIRDALALFNDRGIEAASAALGHLLADDFELVEAAEVPDRETHTGKQAFIANLAKLEESFDELRLEPLEFVDLDDSIVVVVSMVGRGRGSEVPVEASFAQLWSVRDGKAVSLSDHATKQEALRAAAR